MIGTKRPNLTSATRKELAGSFVQLSAGATHYELQGPADGQPVVLIHGNAAPYATWDNTIEGLCGAGLRVLRYDLFGHGFSDRPKLPRYDKRFYNTQLSELLGHLNIPYPVLVVGSSQGGSIGACFASKNPGAVKRLALVAPFFDDFEAARSVLARLVRIPFIGEFLLRLASDDKLVDLSDSIVSAEVRAALEPEVAKQFRFEGKRRAILANWRGDALQDATSCYRGVREQGIPTFLTWGTLDQKLSGESMTRLRELLPEIEYHELDGAGHLAHYEFPELVNPPLIHFLTG